jgi:hypothetical protein
VRNESSHRLKAASLQNRGTRAAWITGILTLELRLTIILHREGAAVRMIDAVETSRAWADASARVRMREREDQRVAATEGCVG